MDVDAKALKRVFITGRIIIFATAAVVAMLQGSEKIIAYDKTGQITNTVFAVLGIVVAAVFAAGLLRGKLKEETGLICMIFGGMLLRAFFVLKSDIWTLQNDTGTYTGFGTDQINIGHIGYIEYIYKFMHLPDMDPYEVFGYFHPPLHHIIEALWLTFQRMRGVPEDLLFENLQVPTLLYSGLCMLVMLHILKECRVRGKAMYAGMALFCFYPRMIVFAGSVNNDILALLFILTTIWRALCWCREKSLGNITVLSLCLGLGMITKLNTAICVFSIALLFLANLIEVRIHGNQFRMKSTLWQYFTFCLVSIPIGMSFIARNLFVFGKKPGLPTQGETSVMYTGNFPLWSRIGLPSVSDLHLDFPFHPISGEVSHNTWVILFQTGLFAESYPAEIPGWLLAVARAGFVCSIAAAVVATVVFFIVYAVKMLDRDSIQQKFGAFFLWFTYLFMLASYVLYVIKYPYTCSSDFRYVAASLVFTSLGFAALGSDRFRLPGVGDSGRILAGAISIIMNMVLVVTLFSSVVTLWSLF